MDLSRYDIAFGDSGYHVIDWLHGVSTEELPAGQEILEEIGAHLRALHSQDWIGAKNQFLYILCAARIETVMCHIMRSRRHYLNLLL